MERTTVESPIFLMIKKRLFLLALILLSAMPISAQEEVNGVWLSPDWYFPGTRKYTETEIRDTATQLFTNLKARNVDAVFFETLLRGYAICPPIEKGARGQNASVLRYQPGQSGFPVYPHLEWNYRVEFDTVIDPLQIFIEEGLAKGIEVHAWVHLYYWRMDNNDIMLSWHDGPSLWGTLMSKYLDAQLERLSFVQDNSVRPGFEQKSREGLGPDIPLQTLKEAAVLFSRGCDTKELERILKAAGKPSQGHPMGTLISWIIQSGGQRPDFLLTAGDDDPFPAPRNTHLRSVYVDPESPAVQKALQEAIVNIAANHPGLSGIHLDHVRYPVDGQGLRSDTGVIDGKYRYFNASDSTEMEQYLILTRTLAKRQAAVTDLVKDIAERLPRRMKLSAAVLPLYYRDKDNGKFRTSGYDYSAQAWLDWPVDFVVPMMYEYHPYLIRTLVDSYQQLANRARPQNPIQVYPGISRIDYTRNGSVKSRGWVFFDLSLARDVKNPRKEHEDLDFGGE